MRVATLLAQALHALVPLSVLSLCYLYLYPVFHGCSFPLPEGASGPASSSRWYLGPFGYQQQAAQATAKLPRQAVFRLLALGDPQLEGDSSLPDLHNDGQGAFPSLAPLRSREVRDLHPRTVLHALQGLVVRDIPRLVGYGRKWLDLLGNDFYLAHIYRSVHAWTDPTHVVVLGDLLGSQWVSDEEFERRSDRFWLRVMGGAQQLPVTMTDEDSWSRRVLAVAGNHDIGYAGDIDRGRIERFESRFGMVNREIRFTLTADGMRLSSDKADSQQSLRLVILNSMNLDSPAKSPSLQSQTYDFLNDAITSSWPLRSDATYGEDATILLTHIPLHKPEGVCTDAPYFDFFPTELGGGVKEQNHLSDHISQQGIIEGLFGMKGNQHDGNRGVGRNGVILTGHDHVGCDVWHFWNGTSSDQSSDDALWTAVRTDSEYGQHQRRDHEAMLGGRNDEQQSLGRPGIREVTVRSMMGEFGGNAGLLSAWFDDELKRWRFEYSSCSLGVQHIWWAVHILALVTILVLLSTVVAFALEPTRTPGRAGIGRSLNYPSGNKESEGNRGDHMLQKDPPPLPSTPKQEPPRSVTSSLTRTESKRMASEVMKQRRERFQRSLRGRKDNEGTASRSESPLTTGFKAPVERDWEVTDSDSPG